MSIYSDTHRILFAKVHENRNMGLSNPEDVKIYSDISYGECENHPEWQLLDLYLPAKKTSDKLPVIISVHGGGFVEGDKDEYRYYCMNLVRNRYAVINFSYRLAPEYPFPACVSDLEKVMHWADKHSAEYGLDTAHVFALGDSAGGHILALYAALITGPNDDGLYINHPKNVSLRALGLNSAELQIPEVKKLSTAQRHMFSDLMGQELSEQLLDKVRLEHRITKDFPAVYMIAGNKDPLCARIPAFCRLLSEKGVEHRCKIYGTEESPLGHVFFLDIRKKISEEATNDELNYFMEMYSQKNI